ncbi:hypothetical protein C1752_16675 [Acaryochloris thomasi RCC1774]|uniref:Uncharacterized protein n=1 Tax=Acaryochloris thomasi RCC1774 TaxID=1764569 RepID=A0A2W1JLP7_9CYAN|nr:hypothetical protein [Acaryochloris thomasi]PZD70211.1 hypothetical protein C1752_16675 [Acaryochloris thomasi RCC1774]
MSFSDTRVQRHSIAFVQVIAPLKKDAIAINESLLEPDAYHRATAESWRQYQRSASSSSPRTTGVDWRLLKQVTGYTRDDLIGFCLDEDLPTISGQLTPHQARQLRDIVLCNWAVLEGRFTEHWQAREALADIRRMLPWTAGDQELFRAWASVSQGAAKGPAANFYLEDAA